MQNKRPITMAESINEAIQIAMKKDKSMLCYGLGTTDPKGIFGTTIGLEKKYGKDRVFDVPASENALTGVSVGLGINGIRSIVSHQRLDFFLLAMDQLVNSAAKWFFTYNKAIPITIRLIVGRGWGQGPTHAQNLHSWFAHIPGLKVVMPSNAYDAKGLLLSSIFDPNPVIFIENRWLHQSISNVPKKQYFINLGKSKKKLSGKKITIISSSYLTAEAINACKYLKKLNIDVDLIDLRTIAPLDWSNIKKSIKKTGSLLVLDSGHFSGSIASEIIYKATNECFEFLKKPPSKLCQPDIPEPSSFGLTKKFYITYKEIIGKVCKMLNCDKELIKAELNYKKEFLHDIPNSNFKGPF